MKISNSVKTVLCLLTAIFLVVFCSITTFAVGEDETVPIDDPVITEPVTEYVEPEYTEPEYTDPPTTEYVEPVVTEPVTEYVEPEYTEPEYTEPQQQQTQYQQQDITSQQQETSYFVAPTVAKTVSNKKYETNTVAGIVSWLCVGVGVLAVFIVAVSTKVSARKASH